MSKQVKSVLTISDNAEERSRLQRLFEDDALKHCQVIKVDMGQAGLEIIQNPEIGRAFHMMQTTEDGMITPLITFQSLHRTDSNRNTHMKVMP